MSTLRLRRLLSGCLATVMLLSLASVATADPGLDEQAIDQGWHAFLDENGRSNAAGGSPDFDPATMTGQDRDNQQQVWTEKTNVPTAVTTLRVGIRYSYTPTGAKSEFYSYNHPQVQLTGTKGSFQVTDKATGATILSGEAGDIVTVTHDGTNFIVTDKDGNATAVTGPVGFHSDDPDNTFKVPSIYRTNILTYVGTVTPEYRGDMEVARGASTPAKSVNLVNIIELEQYLLGNVVNESPAYFNVEALKTQAVSARGYAVANIGRFVKQGYPFDIDDSPGSQVYRGKTSEHPNGKAAVEGTKGLVATYNGKIINAFYSSSMAGYTENYEWSFSGQGNPAQAVPYLTGRYDGPAGTEPDLTTEEGRRSFWTNDQPQVYDSKASAGNSRNRWTFTLTRTKAESNLNANRSYATVISGSKTSIGTLQGCLPTLYSPSARIVNVRCTGSSATWEFRGWDAVRHAFPSPTLGVLDNPAFLDQTYGADGSLTSIQVYGGGWGHNVGMSQYGANGRGKAGQPFAQIMNFYFKDSVIGTHPIEISNNSDPGPGKLRQEFVSPNGQGVLEVRPTGGAKGLHVTINGTLAVVLNQQDLEQPLVKVDISQYLTAGTNVIEYHPISTQGSVTVTVTVYQ